MQTSERSYRCHYTPTDRNGFPVPAESGVLPFIQLRAVGAEQAQRAAHAVTGCPIDNVERIEPIDAFRPLLDDRTRNLLVRAHAIAQAGRFA
mgnify:FL=1